MQSRGAVFKSEGPAGAGSGSAIRDSCYNSADNDDSTADRPQNDSPGALDIGDHGTNGHRLIPLFQG